MLLKNKVAIVTGGTRGIGAAIVQKLVKEGCRVIFTYKKNKSLAEKIKLKTKGKAVGYKVDVCDMKEVKNFVGEVKSKFKGLDILINNAGIARDKSLLLMEERDWDDIINTNLKGAFNLTRSCIFTFMKQKSGNIINIASLSGIVGIEGQTNYCASKAGMIGFSKALIKEVGPFNVRVNTVAPGYIETDITDKHIKKDLKKRLIESTPLRRFGLAEEVADAVVFLASDRSAFIAGQTLIIDGGLSS